MSDAARIIREVRRALNEAELDIEGVFLAAAVALGEEPVSRLASNPHAAGVVEMLRYDLGGGGSYRCAASNI